MTRPFKFLVVGSVVTYLLAVGVAYVVGDALADMKAERILDSSSEVMRDEIRSCANNIIVYLAELAARLCGNGTDIDKVRIDRFLDIMDLDEISVCDRQGVVLLSTDPTMPKGSNFNFDDKNRTKDYRQLFNDNCKYLVEPLRTSVSNPKERMKYCGAALPGKRGFVQVGIGERKLQTGFDMFFDSICVNWRAGEFGYFLLADRDTGRLISALDEKAIGRNLSELLPGLPRTCANDGRTLWLLADGVPAYVRDETVGGHRVLTIIPEREVVLYRKAVVRVAAVLMALLIVVFLVVFDKFDKHNRQIRKYFEDRKAQADKDLALAKAIQANSLPSVFPPYPALVDRIDIHALMLPAKEVGGDFYDFYFTEANKIAIVVADVSGKGVPAAMFMMRAKSTMQGLLRSGGDVADVLEKVNERILDGNEANMFVTAWVGVVDLATGHVEYVNAGHNPPVLQHADGHAEWLREKSGPPLAAVDNVRYRKHEFDIAPGGGLLLYTDGVTEAVDAALGLFGENRLMAFFADKGNSGDCHGCVRTSRGLCDDIVRGVKQFSVGVEQADDITLLSFRLNGVGRDFPATDSGMEATRLYLERYCEDPKPAIITDEIVSNIVRCSGAHGFTMKVIRVDEGLKLVFIDDGVPFDPTQDAPEPNVSADAGDRGIGGLGIYMVKKMSKSVTYVRDGKLNVLSVVI